MTSVPAEYVELEKFVAQAPYTTSELVDKLVPVTCDQSDPVKIFNKLRENASNLTDQEFQDLKWGARYLGDETFALICQEATDDNNAHAFNVTYPIILFNGQARIDASVCIAVKWKNESQESISVFAPIPTRKEADYSAIDELVAGSPYPTVNTFSSVSSTKPSLKAILAECAWNGDQLLRELDLHIEQKYKTNLWKYQNTAWAVEYASADKRILKVSTPTVATGYWIFYLVLTERAGAVRIERPIDHYGKPTGYRGADEGTRTSPPFSHPSLGMYEARENFNPGMAYGPGPQSMAPEQPWPGYPSGGPQSRQFNIPPVRGNNEIRMIFHTLDEIEPHLVTLRERFPDQVKLLTTVTDLVNNTAAEGRVFTIHLFGDWSKTEAKWAKIYLVAGDERTRDVSVNLELTLTTRINHQYQPNHQPGSYRW